jgi:zinc protease
MPITFKLANGLRVVAEPRDTAKVAAFQVWVNAGSADELPGEVGLAHLHEHLLFKGTARRGPGEIARSVEAHGGEINAWTSYDQTVYHVVMASRFAREGLDVLADAVRNSAFDPVELTREIEVVCEEIKRSLDTPSRRASKELFATAYAHHPYGRPVIGFEADVRSHTREKMLGFYRRCYTPQNIVLSAVGDFSEAQVRAWAEELFGGDWGRPFTAPIARAKEPSRSNRQVKLQREAVKEAYLHLAFPCPPVDHEDVPALDVLAMVLGQGDGSRLSLEVKRRRSLCNDVSTWAYTPKDPGIFALSITASGESIAAAFDASVQVLRGATESPVDPGELSTVQALVESESIYSRETAQGLARRMGYYQTMGGLEHEAEYYAAVAKLTPARLHEVAKRYFLWDEAVVSGLLPADCTLDETAVLKTLDGATPMQVKRVVVQLPRSSVLSKAPAVALKIHKLSSGGTVIVRRETAVPLFAVRATFPGGLRYETPQSNGLTALLARTLCRGTLELSAEQVSQRVDALCGGISTVPGRSSFSLRGEFLSRYFEDAFGLFAQVLRAPAFDAKEVEREQQRQLQDIHSRDDRPSSVAFELFAKTLYLTHPYRLSMLGEADTVRALSPAALREFHAKNLDVSQMTLAVVGDVDIDAVVKQAEAAFGKSTSSAAPPHVPVEPAFDGPRTSRKQLQKAQSHVVLGFPGARVSDDWKRPLEVLSTMLSGQSGRLFIELRDKQSLCYSVSSMTVEGVDPGYFAVYIGTSPEKVDQALAGIRAELTKVRDELASPAELERAKQHLMGVHEVGLQRNGARAGVMALDATYGLGADRYLRYADEVNSVTAEQVQQVAARVIDFQKSALTVVGP